MNKAHCRKCWQFLPTWDARCPHCGDINPLRVYDTIGEWSVYLAGSAAVVLGVWAQWSRLV